MAFDDRARGLLFERLDEALGGDAADTLMGYLPPVGWADVATKTDLALLEARLENRMSALENRIDGRMSALENRIDGRMSALEARVEAGFPALEAGFERALRQAVLALVVVMIAAVGAAVSITQLLTG
ncbi:MAG: hypothetical protein JJLCMIEE_01362 [Acidimicrobiales bacterium]|nr:hypothetical protein [Acidimicrobiales bacterium]